MASRRTCADACSSRSRNPAAVPDLLAAAAAAKSAGATVLAICNTPDSPLVAGADLVIEVARRDSRSSVAATKSYLATLAAIARMVAAWTEDRKMGESLEALPDLMERSWALDWSSALPALESAEHLYVIGRGLGLAAAQEVALKCKETCGLHAEAFSSAELRHGPLTLLKQGFPGAAAHPSRRDPARDRRARRRTRAARSHGAHRGTSAPPARSCCRPSRRAPELAPILLVQSAYRMIASLAVRRGYDPDQPAHLRKITKTL